jgi:UDPglucose 6-dehydrogenase
MSHLGLVSALSAASKGAEVVCFDFDISLIKNLKIGHFPIDEPGLEEVFKKHERNLEFTNELSDIKECCLVYISLDVPTDSSGESDLGPIRHLIETCLAMLPPNSNLVILSQVAPGFSRQIQNQASVSISYQVETLIFGSAFERATQPERFLIGLQQPSFEIHPCHKAFLNLFNAPIIKMSYESAELAKISINVFLAASVSATNTMAEISSKLGADWNHVRMALTSDSRIGPLAYTRPGLGISGGNVERDIATALRISKEMGTNSGLLRSLTQNSQYYKLWPLRIVQNIFPDDKKTRIMAVWGISYKKGTHSVKNAPSIENLRFFSNLFEIRFYDPIVKTVEIDNGALISETTALEAVDGADVLVIFNDSEIFQKYSQAELIERMRGKVVIDPFGVLSFERFDNMQYFTLNIARYVNEL